MIYAIEIEIEIRWEFFKKIYNAFQLAPLRTTFL